MIAIIGYGMGNIQSVCNAFEHLGHKIFVATTPQDLCRADKIIIPGVGAFPAAMEKLHQTGFAEEIGEQVGVKDKPVLGICLGMQLLADEGDEFGVCSGLGLIPGQVALIPRNDEALRLPQIGWNELEITRDCPLLAGIEGDSNCYFVHSFQFQPSDPAHVSAIVDYGSPVIAAVSRGNIFGMQFHPEKSQTVGLKILDNFARL